MNFEWIPVVLQLIFLEGILSIDNVAILGALVVSLPDNEPIPWPKIVRGLDRGLDPIFGMQRLAALKAGLLGAYVGRALMLLLAHFIIRNRWLQLLGGGYLIYLAVHQLFGRGSVNTNRWSENHGTGGFTKRGFWAIVLTVELADLAFSLDNVVAAVALSDELWILFLGVGIGIVTMRFAAQVFSRLIEKEPILEPTAYILILVLGTRLFLEHLFQIQFSTLCQFSVSVSIIVCAVLYAKLKAQRRARRLHLDADTITLSDHGSGRK